MIRDNFINTLLSSCLEVQGVWINVIGVVIGLVAWIFRPDENLSLWVAVPILLFLLSIIVALFKTSLTLYKKSNRSLPKVITVKKATVNKHAKFMCLLEPSEYFSYDLIVSFYYKEDKFEQYLGHGLVVNIQDDGYIQAELLGTAEGNEDLVRRIYSNEKEALDNLVIKPYVPRSLLQGGV